MIQTRVSLFRNQTSSGFWKGCKWDNLKHGSGPWADLYPCHKPILVDAFRNTTIKSNQSCWRLIMTYILSALGIYFTACSTFATWLREICMIWLSHFWRRLCTLLNGRNSSERRRMGKKWGKSCGHAMVLSSLSLDCLCESWFWELEVVGGIHVKVI